MDRRRFFEVSLYPLYMGLALFAASLTPSLIPRDWPVQGVLGGLVAALGYMIGRFLVTLWHAVDLPVLRGRAASVAHLLAGIPILGLLLFCLAHARDWQNGIRSRMGMDLIDSVDVPNMAVTALLVFAVLMLLGRLVQWAFDRLRARLYRHMPRRTANVSGLLLLTLALVIVTRDGVLDRVIQSMDRSYTTAQELFDTAPPPPADPRMPGSAASVIDWGAMGQPGRNFVTEGPDARAIAAFAGQPAQDPIRVYVGLAEADTAQERADRALAELQRLGAFERKVLIVAMPTGTGWLDPGSFDVVEYMHGGDIATVAVQYSYLQSPMALLLETQAGLEQARALIGTIHGHWRGLPRERRPRLYIHGLSLGAWASMYGTDLFVLLDNPIDGALWAGPPFPSARWNEAMAERRPGSPYVAPVVGDGRLIRFASHTRDAGGPSGWGDMRLVFLQYSSDPIVFYEPASLWRKPAWMREPPAPDVSPDLSFTPVVTQFQLVVDMILATSAPEGHGHSYYAHDYIGPWAALTDPDGWTPADGARLAARCDRGFQQGCDNG
ncbi:MAG TPA: alpha/beta-hydrolase family protein [Paracoccus sp. (in: a-proteobacteria)]|nr:alpha/beta-hydrolase family protein [Paracoccus sp. (in: a-proteobacteria)]